MNDRLTLNVHDLEVPVLTGIYSEETHLPQPLRISLTVDLAVPARFDPDTPLGQSKNYLDVKHAATTALPPGVHFKLVEAVAEHICDTLFLQDRRVTRVEVTIVKLAIAEAGESIGITLVRNRRVRDALAAALAEKAAIVFARDAGAVAQARAAAARAEIVLLVFDGTVPKLDCAMLLAALGPLAAEFAPTTRIGALDVAEDAHDDDVVAAARFLASAASTTGQVLRIAPR